MAVINQKSVLLGCQTICGRVVAGMVRMDLDTITGQHPANLSYPRHLSSHRERLGLARQNPVGVNCAGADNAALRAGRPAGLAGVLAPCGSRMEPTQGEPCPRAMRSASFMAGSFLGRQSLGGFRSTSMWAKKQPQAKRGWRTPATLTPMRSPRGQKLGSCTASAHNRGHASR